MYVIAAVLQAWTDFFLFKADQFNLNVDKNLSILYFHLFRKYVF